MYARHTALETLRASYEAKSAECAVLEGTVHDMKLEILLFDYFGALLDRIYYF